MRRDERIKAISAYRSEHGCSLKEAADAVGHGVANAEQQATEQERLLDQIDLAFWRSDDSLFRNGMAHLRVLLRAPSPQTQAPAADETLVERAERYLKSYDGSLNSQERAASIIESFVALAKNGEKPNV